MHLRLVPALVLIAVVPLIFVGGAAAAPAQVGLGTATTFAVLAGSTVTNTGPSTINGDLGVSPGTGVTGFPPGTVNGTVHAADGAAAQAQSDLTTAYNDAAGRPGGTTVTGDLGGQTLAPGVYTSGSSMGLTGDVTLDGLGDPNAVFIFQMGSTLTTASGSRVSLINAAQSCNVFWQVGSSATLGSNSTFRGNILALTSITVTTGTTVDGRTLARNGAVTLDTNTITRATCSAPTTATTGGATTTTTIRGGSTATTTRSGGTPQVSRTPTGGVATGGGSTAGTQRVALMAVGGLLLTAAGVAWTLRRQATRSS